MYVYDVDSTGQQKVARLTLHVLGILSQLLRLYACTLFYL